MEIGHICTTNKCIWGVLCGSNSAYVEDYIGSPVARNGGAPGVEGRRILFAFVGAAYNRATVYARLLPAYWRSGIYVFYVLLRSRSPPLITFCAFSPILQFPAIGRSDVLTNIYFCNY